MNRHTVVTLSWFAILCFGIYLIVWYDNPFGYFLIGATMTMFMYVMLG
jgi:hypothetical protein